MDMMKNEALSILVERVMDCLEALWICLKDMFYRHHKKLFVGALILIPLIAVGFIFLHPDHQVKAGEDHPRYQYYTSVQVKADDTLWDIAEDYYSYEYEDMNAYVREIEELNHIDADRITAGHYVVIPYYADEK